MDLPGIFLMKYLIHLSETVFVYLHRIKILLVYLVHLVKSLLKPRLLLFPTERHQNTGKSVTLEVF